MPLKRFRNRPTQLAALCGLLLGVPFLGHLGGRALAQLSEPAGPAGASGATVAALSPYVDVHAHLDNTQAEASVETALRSMSAENAARIIFLPSPFTLEDANRFDAEDLSAAEHNHRDKVSFLGGGGTLNAMLQQAVRTGDVGAGVQAAFKKRAEEIVRLGALGFGEMTAEHPPSSTPYQYAPADHPLFLMLADIAAQHDMPIDLHMEAVAHAIPIPPEWHVIPLPSPPMLHQNIRPFETLLAHNPKAKIVWAHAGWDTTGDRTPALTRRLLAAHPNLYMELKTDPLSVGQNAFLTGGVTGAWKPEWLELLRDFPDRFVIGTDQHYPMPKDNVQRWQAVITAFNQLPANLRRAIGSDNAARIYNPAHGNPAHGLAPGRLRPTRTSPSKPADVTRPLKPKVEN